jgi:hypothetical protein
MNFFMAIDALDTKGETGVREWASESISELVVLMVRQQENEPHCFSKEENTRLTNHILRLAVLIDIGSLTVQDEETKKLVNKVKKKHPDRYKIILEIVENARKKSS